MDTYYSGVVCIDISFHFCELLEIFDRMRVRYPNYNFLINICI
jgi:hypothetical protein